MFVDISNEGHGIMRKIECVNCLECGTEFKKIDSLQKVAPICSQVCFNSRINHRINKYKESRRNNAKTGCQICGKSMVKCDSVMKSKYVCSVECKQKYKSSLPKKLSILSVDYHVNAGLSLKDAEEKVSQLQRARSPRCIEYWITRGYSEDDAIKMVSEYQKRNTAANTMTKEERQKSSPRAIQYWLEKGFDFEDAQQHHKQFNDRSSLNYFVLKYGLEQGTLAYTEECKRRAVVNSIKGYVKKYGEAKGVDLWQNKYKKRGPDSKQARAFFELLYQKLPAEVKQLKIYFKGLTDNEFGTRGDGKYYYYDFVISDIKYCIEFNGSYWHADPTFYSSGTILKMFGKEVLVDDIWEHDRQKHLALASRGFVVKTVWCKDKNLPLEHIDLLVEEIKNRYKEHTNEKN